MLLAASMNNFVGMISILVILIIVLGLGLKQIKQPYIISYILVGAFLGEHGMGLIQDSELIHLFGELGIIILLFFIGMEISLPAFLKKWRVALFGTTLQVVVSVLIILGLGYFYNWDTAGSVVLGFIIALNSSAVIIKILEEKNIIETRLGGNVLSILLTQDIIIVPLLILTSILGGEPTPISKIILMVIGGLLMVGLLVFVCARGSIRLPFSNAIKQDHELQVFVAILFCFGGALLSSLFGLSPALGAFVGGMIMHIAESTEWIHDTLHSFRILFVAIFFIGIGLQIDLDFIYANLWPILSVVLSVYIVNQLLNSLILRIFTCTWKEAILGGALLAQIGEFSFLLSSAAHSLAIFGEYGYKFTISLISLTLIISPFWIALFEWIVSIKKPEVVEKAAPTLSASTGKV